MSRLIVIAVLAALSLAAQNNSKQYKPGEFENYNAVIKDIGANNTSKALTDLDAWKQKYADSDYKDDRDALYVQVYAAANQPVKSLDAASRLLAKDLETAFPGPAGQAAILRLLYSAAWAVSRIPNPTPEEFAAGEKAARQLQAWERPLPGVPPAAWAQTQADMKDKAAAALLYLTMLPGIQAMAKQPPDCTAGDAAWTRALDSYPEKSMLSYELGRALLCEGKLPQAIYEFERAAVVDPTLGGVRTDAKQTQSYADNAYLKFHGSLDGIDELRLRTKQSPLPPADLTIKSEAQIAAEDRVRFETDHPQLALWLKIKSALLEANGQEYFENELKGAAVPQLAGKLVEAKPACRPRELLVAVPLPDSEGAASAEIQLKLDKPLTGRPEPGIEFRWEGVPSAFTREPFVLTMDTEVAKLDGVKIEPCSPTPVRRSR